MERIEAYLLGIFTVVLCFLMGYLIFWAISSIGPKFNFPSVIS